MGPLVIIITLELVITSGIIGFSSYPQTLKQTKHKISNILGIQKIAQTEDNAPPDQTQPADQSSTTEPAPQEQSPTSEQPQTPVGSTSPSAESSPAPAPASVGSPTAAPEAVPSEQTNPEQTPSPSETPNLFEQVQESSSPNPQSSGEPSPSPTTLPTTVETSMSQTQAVLSPEDLINSPEGISDKSMEEVKKEDTQLEQAANPEQQTKLLIDFATDKVKDMNNFSKSDDFTSTNFAAQRFNEQMDKAISNVEKVPPKDQAKLKNQLVNFCDQADKVLRTVELSVPEEGEQDLEIARGQCQELNL